ncbi:MAG: helix-turn-helix transcriptional regulator [Candidatus Bipolaricaulis sp.]|nr:helix-turn-helix transcriptional regulator [Candidatus Bipolaricaulis sp.]MDD5219045.1 helix-turn-helix transcriptional regulator [Candidatus Bipolaricaulis sp.]
MENRLREARTSDGRTQEDLARAVGVTRQTVLAIEKGGYEPSVRLALLLARELAVSVDDLFWLAGAKGRRA